MHIGISCIWMNPRLAICYDGEDYELYEESRGEMCTRQQCGASEQQALQENRTVDARAVCEIWFFSGWSDA